MRTIALKKFRIRKMRRLNVRTKVITKMLLTKRG
jgi:hypothetical protein